MNRSQFLVAALSAFASSFVFATTPTVTVSGVSPYSISSSKIYYLSATNVPFDSSSGYINIDPTDTTGSLIYLDIDASSLDSSLTYAVGVEASALSSTTLLPIERINGSTCGSSACPTSVVVDTVTYYTSAIITQGSTNRIAINLQNICKKINDTGVSTGSLCDNKAVNTTVSDSRSLQLTVWVGVSGTDFSGDTVPTEGTAGASDAFSVTLQGGAPSASCPSDVSSLYFPGDGEILAAPNKVTGTVTSIGSNHTAIQNVVIFGNETDSAISTPTASGYSTPYLSSGFTIIGRLSPDAGEATVSGFKNTSKETEHSYSLGVAVIDGVGAISPVGCTFNGVRTSEVEGFLAKSKCFIATAAFNSGDAPAVRMLRKFRDQVLLNSELGNQLVEIYYRHSPAFAEWVIDHPAFRVPTLFFLIPVQLAAFLMLHPFILALMTLVGFVIIISAPKKRIRA